MSVGESTTVVCADDEVVVTVHVNIREALSEPSDALTVTLKVPAVETVPEITPVDGLIASPVGSPEAEYETAVPCGSVAMMASDTAVFRRLD